MRYQERIYIQTDISNVRNKDILNVNMSSDICVFEEPEFNVTGATKIHSGMTNGDTGVYIISSANTITLGFVFTANTASFIDDNAIFKYEIYKYESDLGVFSPNRVYSAGPFEYSSFSGTSALTQSIPIINLNLDGEYLIKGYYIHDICTDFLNRLGLTNDTIKFKSGKSYGLYDPDKDFYFIALIAADTPIITSSINSTTIGGTLHQQVIIPNPGSIVFAITNNYVGDFIITLNGLALANEFDYTFSGNIVTLSGATAEDDIITVIYTTEGTNPLYVDNIDVTSIQSGPTDGQGINKSYYNTTTNKYEVYTSLTPSSGNDILVMLNGVTLAGGIDFYQSISNPKRIILEGNLVVGDIVSIVYFIGPSVINGISTNKPTITWYVNNAPNNLNGKFTVEVSSGSTFSIITSSAETAYIIGESHYSATVSISGSAGTNLYYRVKNGKSYTTISNDIIESIKFSDTIPITIITNSINSY